MQKETQVIRWVDRSIIKKKRCRNVAITEVILIRLQMRLSGM